MGGGGDGGGEEGGGCDGVDWGEGEAHDGGAAGASDGEDVIVQVARRAGDSTGCTEGGEGVASSAACAVACGGTQLGELQGGFDPSGHGIAMVEGAAEGGVDSPGSEVAAVAAHGAAGGGGGGLVRRGIG